MELTTKSIEEYHPNLRPVKTINGELGWGWISMVIKEIVKNERAEYDRDILILHELKDDGKRYFYVIRPADAVGEKVIFNDLQTTFVNTTQQPIEREFFLLRAKSALEGVRANLQDFATRLEKANESDNDDEYEEIKEEIDNYGLSFDYVPCGTWEYQKSAYWRWQIAYGGPSYEVRFYDNCAKTTEFVFLDWFEGVGIDVTELEEFQFIKDHFEPAFDWAKEKALEE